jgi:hypothetical protein
VRRTVQKSQEYKDFVAERQRSQARRPPPEMSLALTLCPLQPASQRSSVFYTLTRKDLIKYFYEHESAKISARSQQDN